LALVCQRDQAPFLPYHLIILNNRKGWQKKASKEVDLIGELLSFSRILIFLLAPDLTLTGNTYHVYDQPNLPAANAYHYLQVWIKFYETYHKERQAPLSPDDHIFPNITSKGFIQPHIPMNHESVQKILAEFTEKSGISKLVVGNFTTHTFRRGGAQHRFMDAEHSERWSLSRVRWWGGWAEGEQVSTNDMKCAT
jgi:hypothetical protein